MGVMRKMDVGMSDFEALLNQIRLLQQPARENPKRLKGPRCGARRKYDGQPCQCKALANGKCKFHGGMSTGPRTPEGKQRALMNLRQYREAFKAQDLS